jgi:hypothetical protein
MNEPGTYSAKIELIDSTNPHVIDLEQRPMWYVTQPEVGQAFEFYYPQIKKQNCYGYHDRRIETSLVETVIRHSHYGEPTHFSIVTRNSIYRVTDIRRNE